MDAERIYTVKALAAQIGVSPELIRYYTRIGLLKPKRDPDNNYKLFSLTDIQRLQFILQAKQLGFTLAEIQGIIDQAHQGRSPCPRVREIIAARICETRQRLAQLLALQQRMEQALVSWQQMPDKLPDGDSVCHLIESTMAQDDPTQDVTQT